MGTHVVVSTALGPIRLRLRPDAAPVTCAHFLQLLPLFNGCCFYRSDFVIQCGLQRAGGGAVPNPHPNIPVNETTRQPLISNVRGTCAFGHWDVPDNGNSDWFINLQANPHLDDAYGGYCVFAQVDADDAASFGVIDAIAGAVLKGQKPTIHGITAQQ